jgi:hypothetical protein
MPTGAVGLVAIAAVCHASWNLITKRTGGGIAFLWLFGITATILMLPVAWFEVARMDRSLQRQDLIAVLGSGFIHIFYFSLLQEPARCWPRSSASRFSAIARALLPSPADSRC